MSKGFKRVSSWALIFVLVFSIGFNVAEANDQPVTVKLNGQTLAFEVNPQIIDGYTMVPIGQIITDLTGQIAQWNANTKTMRFTTGNDVVEHTVGTNRLYINGTVKDYPYASVIINSRTLVPVRMLADATNVQIDWDANTKTVLMTQTTADIFSQPSQTGPINQPQPTVSGQGLRVIDLHCVNQTPEIGRQLRIDVIASSDATRAWLYTADKGEFSETTTYSTDNTGRRTFEVNWTPSNSGTETVTAYVSNNSGDRDYMKLDVHVSHGSNSTEIVSYTATPSHIDVGDTIDVTVITNNRAEYVWYEFEGERGDKTYDYSVDGNRRTFYFSVDTEYYDGGRNASLHIYAADNNGNRDDKTARITIDDNSSGRTEILNINPSNTSIDLGENVNVEVTTTRDISRVMLQDSDGKTMSGVMYSSSSNRSKVWHFDNYKPDSAGRKDVTISAYSSDGHSTTQRFYVNVGGQSQQQSRLKIENIDYDKQVTPGDTTITIYTTDDTGKYNVSLTSSSKSITYEAGEPDRGAGQTTIPVSINFPEPGTYNVNVKIGTNDGRNDSKPITIVVKDE